MSTSARGITATSPTASVPATPTTPSGRNTASAIIAAAAAIIADAVFLPVGVVGVAGTEAVGDVAVIPRALVDIVDHQVDRRAGGRALEGAGEDLDLVGLLALRRIARLAR